MYILPTNWHIKGGINGEGQHSPIDLFTYRIDIITKAIGLPFKLTLCSLFVALLKRSIRRLLKYSRAICIYRRNVNQNWIQTVIYDSNAIIIYRRSWSTFGFCRPVRLRREDYISRDRYSNMIPHRINPSLFSWFGVLRIRFRNGSIRPRSFRHWPFAPLDLFAVCSFRPCHFRRFVSFKIAISP